MNKTTNRWTNAFLSEVSRHHDVIFTPMLNTRIARFRPITNQALQHINVYA